MRSALIVPLYLDRRPSARRTAALRRQTALECGFFRTHRSLSTHESTSRKRLNHMADSHVNPKSVDQTGIGPISHLQGLQRKGGCRSITPLPREGAPGAFCAKCWHLWDGSKP